MKITKISDCITEVSKRTYSTNGTIIWNEPTVERLVRLIGLGRDIQEISQILGVTKYAVRHAINRYTIGIVNIRNAVKQNPTLL